jgi:SAM-dependent methyltransferase
MRISYRHQNTKEYWAERWENISVDQPMENADAYPLKYAELTISTQGKILEAGCGAGRLLRYYKQRGYDISGIDFIEHAITTLKQADPDLQVRTADITDLPYPADTFQYVLSFGLLHNLEYGLSKAMQETYRVLQTGGKVCASFRADNVQTRLSDCLAQSKRRRKNTEAALHFHKRNLTRSEFVALFEDAGFVVEAVYPVENMPLLYRFPMFRAKYHKTFDESRARVEGYKLTWVGAALQRLLMLFPESFCNLFVIIARKPAE